MAIVAAAGVVGAVAGARTALIMDETLLRRIFAVVLVIIAVRMAVRAVSLFRASRAIDGG
jgi:uncharacterized membrane protein YfcA